MRRTAYLAACMLALASCEVKDKNAVNRVPPNLRSNSPVAFGEELKVSTVNYTDDVCFTVFVVFISACDQRFE